MPVTEFEICLQ